MADPNWLLSAVAQSTAALVAIVGGLIVSRLIGLSSERSALERQLRHLRDRVASLREETTRRRQWLVADDVGDAVLEWVEAIFESDDDISDEGLLEVSSPGGWDLSDYAPHLRNIRDVTADAVAAYEDIRELLGHGVALVDTFEEVIEDTYLEAPENPWARTIWERVWDLWTAREQKRSRQKLQDSGVSAAFAARLGLDQMLSRDWAVPVVPSFEVPDPRRDQEERDFSRGIAQLQSTTQEIERVSEDLEDVVQPPGLWLGFGVLTAFAAVGIVFPVIVMATLPETLHVGLRISVVVLFVAGLASLLGYIAWFARHLRS